MAAAGEAGGARATRPGPPLAGALVWVGPPLFAAAFAAMAAWTWGAWPDVLVDFGRELYAPWRLAQGAELFGDVAWFNGPLSAWVNAALFELFGASLRTLVVANLALFALLCALVWWLLRSISDVLAALAGTLVLILLFGFGQLVGIGNYNFVCPYSHEVTHGLLLAVGALCALRRWDGRRSLAWVALAGLLLGACFLTKAEVFLAALLGCGTALALTLWSEPAARERRGVVLGVAVAGALVPVLLAFARLASALPAGEALRGALGSWPWVLAGGAEELAFYRQGMGLDAPGERVGELLTWSLRWIVVLAPSALLAWALRSGSRAARVGAGAALVVTAGGLAWLASDARWLAAARPLPLFVLVLGSFAARRLVAHPERRREAGFQLALCVFALALLAKMLLNARVFHYGFALALPATLLVVVALVGWIPAWLDGRGRAGDVLRAGALAALALGVVGHLRITQGFLDRKTETVGTGADAFRADLRGRFVSQALEGFARHAPPGATLAVLPEGVTINWLARAVNPTPYVNFMPPELLLFGERRIVEAFEAAPPDFVMLVHKDTSEYGVQFFGPDYGAALARWVQEHYVAVEQYGQPPLRPGTVFGIQLLRRR